MVKNSRICIVLPNIYPALTGRAGIKFVGGAELRHSIAARSLAQRGYDVSVVSLDHGQPEGEVVDGIRVLKSHTPDGGVPVLRFLYPRLAKTWMAMKRANADIYYQPCAGYLTGIVAAFCRRHGRKSVFAGASDTDFIPDRLRIQYARDRWLYKYGMGLVDAVVVQTERQRSLCHDHFGREATVIPNAYEPPYDPPRTRREYVLWVGSIRPVKRPDRFLAIARALPQLRFRMIGGPTGDGAGAHTYYEQIRNMALTIPNLEFMGFLPYAETEPHFDNAAVFVNTSDVEGFPNTFLQAWARGIPTVSFFDAALSGHGVYRHVSGEEEAVRAIREFTQDDDKWNACSMRCNEYVKQHHATSVVMASYEQLFASLNRGPQVIS